MQDQPPWFLEDSSSVVVVVVIIIITEAEGKDVYIINLRD